MRLVTYLQQLYTDYSNEWVNKNGCVFLSAKQEGLAIAGSIAVAIGRKRAIRNPGDIDFVCSNVAQARAFIRKLEDRLMEHRVYWRVQVNHKTEFCPENCTTHFRIVCPFWLPICVMVIGEVNQWRTYGGNLVQRFNDVVEAAQSLDERDGKGRLDEEPREVIRSPIDLDDDPDTIGIAPERGEPYP